MGEAFTYIKWLSFIELFIYLTIGIHVVVIITIIKFSVVCNVRKYTCRNLCCKKNAEKMIIH